MGDLILSRDKGKLLVPSQDLPSTWNTQTAKVTWKGTDYSVFPHTPTYVLALRNMGINAPGLIGHYYNWPGADLPFEAQRVTADTLVLNRRCFVLNDIGTGKTRSALFAVDFLMTRGVVNKCLIVAPLSTLASVWEQEIMMVMPHRTSISLYHPTRKGRLKRLKESPDFYVINHHGTKVIQEELAARPDIDCVIIDELATFRNPQTDMWKSMNAVIQNRRYVWGMTGSPTPNSPEDAYGQIKLLTPERAPKSARAWRSMTMDKITQFIWTPKKTANDTVYQAMRPGVRFSRDDCLDLPERMVSTQDVTLSPRQAAIYKELTQRYKAKLFEGDVTAANEGVLMNKLLQVSCGFVYTNEKGEVDLQNQNRLDVLESIIRTAKHKVIVFAPFVFAVGMLEKEVSKYATTGLVHGGVSKSKRDQIFRQFQHGTEMKTLIAHPACMAHGLTLTSSNVIVWYSPISSAEIYEQANGRITRAGQKNKQYVVHLAGTPVERRTYSRLRRRQRMQGVLLDMFNGVEEAA